MVFGELLVTISRNGDLAGLLWPKVEIGRDFRKKGRVTVPGSPLAASTMSELPPNKATKLER